MPPVMSETTATPAWVWSQYWKGGQGFSLSCGAPGRDEAESLRGLWAPFFENLPDGAAVLDLATGAGQAARWAAQAGRGFSVTGVDYAETPASDDPALVLIGGVSIEALPFADASFDAAISQFGFEYADTQAAAREAARVLRPGAKALFLVHHVESALTLDYAGRAAAFQAALVEAGPSAAIRSLYESHLARAQRGEIDAAKAKADAALAAAARALSAGPAHAEARRYVEGLRSLAAQTMFLPPEEGLKELDKIEALIEGWLARWKAQAAAALDHDGAAALARTLADAGFEAAPPAEFRDAAGILLGWRVDLIRKG